VNLGNADADGANVNSNQPDNSNDNLGVLLSRSLKPKGAPAPLLACKEI